ncbi:hypothetical protein Tco_0794865 [Tanacetum coccineum]
MTLRFRYPLLQEELEETYVSQPLGMLLGYITYLSQVDYAKLIWEDIIHKLNKKTREKVVPYPRFISFLLEYMMPEYDNEELTIHPHLDMPMDFQAPKTSSQTEKVPPGKKPGDKSGLRRNFFQNTHLSPRLRHPNPKLANQQAAGGPTSLGATSEEGAHPQLSSDKTKSARDGLKTTHTNLDINEESRSDEISKKIKMEDLIDLMKDTRSAFFTPDSP